MVGLLDCWGGVRYAREAVKTALDFFEIACMKGVVGHKKGIAALKGDVLSGAPAHAYLLSGPAGIGKFMIAMRMAQMLQCEATGGASSGGCDECAACREMVKGYHADTVVVEDNDGAPAAKEGGVESGKRESVKVEQVRKIIEKVLTTRNAAFKVVVIQNIERMTPEASNTLLKMLEEPPQQTVFLLTTSRLRDVLPTIISRTRLVRFERLSGEEFADFVDCSMGSALGAGGSGLGAGETGMDGARFEAARFFAEGLPGKATRLLQDEKRFANLAAMRAATTDMVENPDLLKRMRFVADISAQAKEEKSDGIIQDFLWTLELVLRKKLLTGDGSVAQVLHECLETHKLLQRNIHKRMLLESLLFHL